MRCWLAIPLCLACQAPEPDPGVTETGNPELSAGVALRARSSDPDTISVSDGTIVFDEASNTELLREFEAALLDAMDLEVGDA